MQVREAEAERRRRTEREKAFQPPPTKTDGPVDSRKGIYSGFIMKMCTLV